MYERPGYRTLLGRIRNNVRLYIRKQLDLPRQEIAEIVRANLAAVKWFGIALALVLGALVALTVFVIGLIAIFLPLWAATRSGFHYRFTHAGLEIRTLGLRLRSIPKEQIRDYRQDSWNWLGGYGIRGLGEDRAYVWTNSGVRIRTFG